MAAFPALEPATRSYSQGIYPVASQAIFAADPVLFLHRPKAFGYRLKLGFVYLTAAEAKLIRDHWRSQAGGTEPFLLGPSAMLGHGNMGIVSDTKRWRYSGPPAEQHLTGGLMNVTVELETAEGTFALGTDVQIILALISGAAGAAGPAMAVGLVVSFAPGSAEGPDHKAPGVELIVTVAMASGAAGAPPLQTSVTMTITAGAASSSAVGMARIIGAKVAAGAAIAF